MSPSLAGGQPRCDTAGVGLLRCPGRSTLLRTTAHAADTAWGRARCETCAGLGECLSQVRAAWSAACLWVAASRTSGVLQHLKKSLGIIQPLKLQGEESPRTAPQTFLLKSPSPVKEDRSFHPYCVQVLVFYLEMQCRSFKAHMVATAA